MSTVRNTYKYRFKVGNKVVYSGITKSLERREHEHKQTWPDGHIKQVGRRTTKNAAISWDKEKNF
jgi:predicted GIY-YIG superfamily endonuclease